MDMTSRNSNRDSSPPDILSDKFFCTGRSLCFALRGFQFIKNTFNDLFYELLIHREEIINKQNIYSSQKCHFSALMGL
jgi:hypothetical protein